MRLIKLNIEGIRNLNNVQLSLNPQFNFFFGSNGSGKTSLLEAIYLLGRGRSFRTTNLPSVINRNRQHCTVSGLLLAEGGRQIRMGVTRDLGGQFNFRVNGVAVQTASSLAAELPILLFNADTFALLNGGPSQRRAYLDWAVFHVEQSVRVLWQRYQRALKQRNNLLRHDKMDGHIDVWDAELAKLAGEINQKRRKAAERLFALIPQVLTTFEEVPQVNFAYYQGWDEEQDLQDVLKANLESDKKRKATNYGPHRADVKIMAGEERAPAKEVLSRGQQKILVSAMQIARGRLLADVANRKSVYLLDDLPSELDREHRLKLARLLKTMDAQVLITGVDSAELRMEPVVGEEEFALFHVEHGTVVTAN